MDVSHHIVCSLEGNYVLFFSVDGGDCLADGSDALAGRDLVVQDFVQVQLPVDARFLVHFYYLFLRKLLNFNQVS